MALEQALLDKAAEDFDRGESGRRGIHNTNGTRTHNRMYMYLRMANSHAYAGDFPAAIEAWTRAIQALPGPPLSAASNDLKARCLANRAQAFLQLRDYAAAERDCGASLRLVPTNVKVLLRRATVRAGPAGVGCLAPFFILFFNSCLFHSPIGTYRLCSPWSA